MGTGFSASLSGFSVRVLQDPDQLEEPQGIDERIWGALINVGAERMSSPKVDRLLSRVRELLPEVPVAVLSDFEDAGSIREAFNLGVRGYIQTSWRRWWPSRPYTWFA